MSSSDDGGTKRTRSSSSGEGAPANSHKKRKTTLTSQQTAVPLLEGRGRESKNGDQDRQVDKLKEEDTRHLTNIQSFFPELAWRKVAEKLKKKADIENCSNASPFFGNLLREKRERKVVLPTVFGILAKRYCDEYNKDESYKETNVESIPWERPVQTKKPNRMTGIWKCRLVSKNWNKAIEEIHRNKDAGHFHTSWDFDTAPNYQLGVQWGPGLFQKTSHVLKFLGHFEATHYSAAQQQQAKKCPFLRRFVRVEFSPSRREHKEAFFNSLVEMFEKFGDQVWYFMLYWWYNEQGDEYVCIYRKLKQFVKLMPNLKVLSIAFFCFPFSGSSKQEAMFPALEEEIERNPFPQLANLEMISVGEIPGVLRNHLVHQNLQVSKLEISSLKFNGNCPLLMDKLPNLNQLSLVEMESVQVLDALDRYPFTLNVEKFTLISYYPFVGWSRVFNVLGSKLNSDICTELQLGMPGPMSDAERMSVLRDSLVCRLKLANIERFQNFNYPACFLDFLLPSKNTLDEMVLRCYLNRTMSGRDAERDKLVNQQVIKFWGNEGKMEESNIATELSRLRKLRVEDLSCRLKRHYHIQPNGVIKVEKEKSWR